MSEQTIEKTMSGQDTGAVDHGLVDFWANAANPAVIKRWRRSILRRRLLWKLTISGTEAMKRFLDIVGGLAGCLFFTPIFGVVAV